MVSINNVMKPLYQGNAAIKKEANQAVKTVSTSSLPSGKTVKLSKSDWIEILHENIRRFKCVLRANPNDEVTRSHLRNSENLLDKIYSSIYKLILSQSSAVLHTKQKNFSPKYAVIDLQYILFMLSSVWGEKNVPLFWKHGKKDLC